jgi:hypothetical protein
VVPPTTLQLQQALVGALAAPLTGLTAAHDVFEVYILDLVAQGAIREGALVTVRRPDGAVAAPPYRMRSFPGRISTTSGGPVHLLFEFPNGDRLEAHQGIYVTGRSLQRHECDVAVLTQAEADSARGTGGHPRSAALVFAAECKLYDRRLGIATAREYAGLNQDLSPQGLTRRLVTNHQAELVKQYLSRLNLFYRDDVRPGGLRVDQFIAEVQTIFGRISIAVSRSGFTRDRRNLRRIR